MLELKEEKELERKQALRDRERKYDEEKKLKQREDQEAYKIDSLPQSRVLRNNMDNSRNN